MKISAAIASSKKIFNIAKCLDGQAFFLYCAHAPVIMSLCTYAAYYALPDTAGSIAVVAAIIISCYVNAAICTGIGIFLSHFCPRVFALLTGGRAFVIKQ